MKGNLPLLRTTFAILFCLSLGSCKGRDEQTYRQIEPQKDKLTEVGKEKIEATKEIAKAEKKVDDVKVQATKDYVNAPDAEKPAVEAKDAAKVVKAEEGVRKEEQEAAEEISEAEEDEANE